MKTLLRRRGYSGEYLKRKVNEALEEATEIAEEHNGCVDIECLSKSNCGETIASRIRALKKT